MRVMVLVKATKDSEAGLMPSSELFEAMGNPSSGGLAVVQAEASELAASIDWTTHEERARTKRLILERTEALFRTALGPLATRIDHIGSTSVPGLPAKPIIDIDLAVADPADEGAYIPDLEALGYVHWLTEPEWHQHRLLKQLNEPRVHLHVFGPDCPEMVRHQMFRDWLIAHPEDRRRYAAAKRAADARTHDREILRLAGPEAAGLPQQDLHVRAQLRMN